MYNFNQWLKFREAGEVDPFDWENDDLNTWIANQERQRRGGEMQSSQPQPAPQQQPKRPQGVDPKKVQDAYQTLSFSAKNNPRVMFILKNVQADVLNGSLKGPMAQALINAAETNDLNGLIQAAGQGQQQPTTSPQQPATGGFKVTTALGIKPDEVEILPFPNQNKTGFRNKRQGSPGFGRVFYIDNGLDQAAKEKFFKDLRPQFGT